MERDIERYFKKKVESLGALCFKLVCPGKRGVPDRIVVLGDGRVVWVELKDKAGVVSEIQKYRHGELIARGQAVTTLYSKDDVEDFIDGLKVAPVPRIRKGKDNK